MYCFSLYRRDRKKRKGGGVCIYVKDSIQSCIYSDSDDFEVLWVKIHFCDNCFYIADCYHLPNPKYNPVDFVTQLCSTIRSIIDSDVCPVFLITGDFNALCTDFLEEEFGLNQLVYECVIIIIAYYIPRIICCVLSGYIMLTVDMSLQTRKFYVASNSILHNSCLLYTSPSPRDRTRSRMPSSA